FEGDGARLQARRTSRDDRDLLTPGATSDSLSDPVQKRLSEVVLKLEFDRTIPHRADVFEPEVVGAWHQGDYVGFDAAAFNRCQPPGEFPGEFEGVIAARIPTHVWP